MTIIKYQVRPGTYYDSAVLMQLQRGLAQLPGVLDAGVVMATQANCKLLQENDLLPRLESSPGPEDLLLVVLAEDDASGEGALNAVDSLLSRRPAAELGAFNPRSIETALKTLPDANWAIVSVPGRYAAAVAVKALDLGLNVFLYSDNVPIEDEVRLKQTARERGKLVMGPDCGTAIVNGIGLGFANRVRRGNIGVVGASGTGLQAVTIGVHRLGGGISQALGTGGRDLHASVGGISSLQSLELLARDPGTDVIVIISKPPAPEVAADLLGAARGNGKPVVVYFIGQPAPVRTRGNLHFAANLSEAAALAIELSRKGVGSTQMEEAEQAENLSGRYLRGLFSGGTLAYEAVLSLQGFLSPLYTNVPLNESQALERMHGGHGHTIIDFGADEFTSGRLHPMIDNELRIRRLREEAADPAVASILLDVVLGEGAHPDPASEFAPVIAEAVKRQGLEIHVVILGTEEDRQDLPNQELRFETAGAHVYRDLQDALAALSPRFLQPAAENSGIPIDLLTSPVTVINLGLESFYESVTAQGARAVHVDWKPPAGGNERMMDLLARVARP